MKKVILQLLAIVILTGSCIHQLQAQSIIFDNGPYFNSVGTGAGGANESVLYTTTFGMGTIGFGHQANNFNRVADDFTFTDCMWRIDSIVFFGYQTGSTLTSTFTAVNFRIWDSIPDAPGSTIVFGDTTTNRMIATAFSGTYRITETTVGNSTRPIMRNVCNASSIYLPAGTYWLDWQSSGSLASGPWAQPRTPVGVAITGNGRQRIGQVWNNLLDGGTGTPAQGLPFIIYGEVFNVTADAGVDGDYCGVQSIGLGGAPSGTGGLGSLAYAWSSSPNISDTTLANPMLTTNSSGSYVLTVSDTAGCMAWDTVVINSLPLPLASITPVGPITFCNGDQATLTAGAGIGYEFLWSTSDTTSTINATTAGWFTLDVTDSAGCTDNDSVEVIVNPAPINTVNQVGPSLTADQAGASYQWVDCNSSFSPIAGATGQNYTAIANGSYAVIVDLGGCVDTSACQTVFGFGIENTLSENIQIFPNPAEDIFYIQLHASSMETFTITIYDVLGKEVESGLVSFVTNAPIAYSCATWQPGMYLIRGVGTKTGVEFQQRVIVK